jgi:hypothetical protein
MNERLTCVVTAAACGAALATGATGPACLRRAAPRQRSYSRFLHRHFPLAAPDWAGSLARLESVGGRAHESQCIRIVWSGGDAAYRNGRTDAFSRYALRERHWHLKVLRRCGSHRKTLRSTAAHC